MKNEKQSQAFHDIFDGQFVVSAEIAGGKGEDSFCCSRAGNAALIGVFDGCGGLGARQYDHYEKHTGAYIASRLASGAVYDWFRSGIHKGRHGDLTEELRERTAGALLLGEQKGGSALKLRGAMVRDFPTTAAIALAEYGNREITVQAVWAGDTRVYILNENGLSPLSKDDTHSRDAFEDLRDDPVQTNVLSSDGRYTLHTNHMRLQGPTAVVAATDGYFGYWRTPMHFEYFLLDTLRRSGSLSEWKEKLHSEIQDVTGDDATMAVMLFSFGTFENLKQFYADRCRELEQVYIQPLTDAYTEEKARTLWQDYRSGYERYLK